MTMTAAWRICPKCGRRYAWNPDVGKVCCPHCNRLANLLGGIIGIWKGKK